MPNGHPTIIVDRIHEYLRQPGKTVNRGALAKAMWAFRHSTVRQLMEDRSSKPGHLYATAVTHPCARKSAYKYFGFPEDEPLSPRAIFNFAAGDVIEIQVLCCARIAGVDIRTPKEVLKERGLPREAKMTASYGTDSMTCWPDGLVYEQTESSPVLHNVEIKKMSDYAFDEMKATGVLSDDWGYRTQTSLEVKAWRDLGVPVLDTVFVGIRGLTGTLDEWRVPYDAALVAASFGRKAAVESSNPTSLPPQAFSPVAETYRGKPTGKQKLPVQCAYCGWKATCWASCGWVLGMGMKSGRPVWYVSKREDALKLDDGEPTSITADDGEGESAW